MKEYQQLLIKGLDRSGFNPSSEQPYIGGIPIDFKKALSLSPGEMYQEVVTGKESGHPISVSIGSHTIKIIDMNNNAFHFSSTFQDEANPEDREQITNSISFDIRTVDRGTVRYKTHIRQPDFRAFAMAQGAMAYFEKRFGQINAIDFFWEGFQKHVPASDNYLKYKKEKREIFEKLQVEGIPEELALDRARQQAALSTWTGQKLAVPRELTRVRDINDSGSVAVTGKFVRAN